DPTFAPVWVDLPGLPLDFFHPAMLQVIGDDIGKKFLSVAKDTICRTRPSVARICVEMNIHEEMPNSIWLEGPNYPGFWQPIYYPNFLYCSHCYKMGHSLQNCNKKNPQQEKQAPGGQGIGQNGKQQQGAWQTQKTKRVYKQVANHNSHEAGTSRAKDAQGQEVGDTQGLTAETTNTFSVLNDINEDNESAEMVDNNERTDNTTAQLQAVTIDTIAENLVSKVSTEATVTPVMDTYVVTTEPAPAANVEEVPRQTNEEGNHTTISGRDTTPSPTQVINLEHPGYRSLQNRSIGSDIAEEFINSEVLTIDEEIQDHAQITPLAIEGPLMVQEQGQVFFLTDGNKTEEDLSEEENEVHNEELEGHCSDSELLTRKSKTIPPSHMCTRSKTNPYGSTKKKRYQCCRQ
ncbi:hypothetical protein FRX31_033241, partial [Thalictrum thalictroides]